MRCCRNLAHVLDGPHLAPASIMRVLDGNKRRPWKMNIAGITNGVLDVIRIHDTPLSWDLPSLNTRQHRYVADLIVEDMALGFRDELIPALRVSHDGDLIAHRAGTHEQTSLLAQHFRTQVFQPDDSRVLAVDVIADFGRRHRIAHGLRRLCNRIRTKIDHGSLQVD